MTLITTNLQTAIKELNEENLVAIPTETVYGLAAKITSEIAIKKVFSLKNRPLNHPLIVHVAKGWELSAWVSSIPEYAHQLMNVYWPGPLTLVLPVKQSAINPLITGGQDSVAIRCPAHPLAQELLVKLGVPVVAPSANPFGKISPTTAEHVSDSFPNSQLTILDGGRCQVGIESTILDARQLDSFDILRPGILSLDEISHQIQWKRNTKEDNIRVPGKMESHYQPQKPLYVFKKQEELEQFYESQNKQGFIISKQKPHGLSSNYHFPFPSTPEEAAYELYFQLRAADQSPAEFILIELPEDNAEWAGVRERILKAGICYKSIDNTNKIA